jgi:plasmid stabilization system protein ParE
VRSSIHRCRAFLLAKNPRAADAASQTIKRHLGLLRTSPEIGRTVSKGSGLRELVIPYGTTGYLALYKFDPAADVVLVLAFRHQREAEY